MRILLIRHGDPDYINDTLTETGRIEAQSLANYITERKIDYCYVSPLGRAVATAEYSLKALNMEAETLEWMREFAPRISLPDVNKETQVAWDWLPTQWMNNERFYDKDNWWDCDIFNKAKVKEEAEWVYEGLDTLLKKHGYERDGNYYKAVRANDDTIALFCHFGLSCVVLGHLIGASPMVLWHGMCSAPTSVTTIYTEERRAGVASFRMSEFGDVSHLIRDGLKPSFSGRFCELNSNENERHD